MARRAALLALALALRVGVAVAPPPSPEDDSGVPEAVAWSHPIGDPPVSRGPPRCRGRCVDDGEAAGAPLGGMGAGTLGRTYRGDFAQWHLRPGTHTHAPAAHTFAAVRVDGLATVLSSLEAHGGWENDGDDDVDETSDANRANRASTISSRRRVLPADGSGGTYRALYPRSSYEYVPGSISARGDVALTQTQFSPVLPGRYREASLPVAVFRFTARNTEIATRSNDAMNATKTPRKVALMFQFENPTRTKEVAPHANGKTRLAGEGSEHAAFGGGAEYASDAETKTPHKGAHMYTKRVLHEHSPGAKNKKSVSEPWHGGLAVAAAETKGARVTVTSGIFSRAAAANHWRAFELRGECVSETGVDSVKHRVDVPSNATLAYSAVCVSFLLPPGASREVVFSVAWDFPVASFDDDAAARAEKNGADAFATAFVKRYARYHPHGGDDVPLGAAAPALAALALARASEWEDAVRAWQKPYVDSAKPRTEKKSNADDDADATLIRRPPWFVSALFNELHHLVDAGTVWGRPLGVAGLDGVADSFFVKKCPSLSESEYVSSFAPRATATAFDDFDEGEDGEGGDAFDVAGNGGVWGGSLGRFGFAQNRDAPVYNSLPAYFFGSWGIAKFWPGIDLSVVADLASAVRFEDDAERDTKWAADRVAAQAGDLPEDATTTPSQKNAAGSVSVARKRRKVFGAAPHDLGDTRDGSLFGRGPLRDSVNAHDVSDVNAWLDLAPMLSLLVARAHVLRLEEDEDDVLFSEESYDAPTLERPPRGGVEKKRKKPTGSVPAGLPNAVLRSLFEDAYLSVSTLARTRDPDGDGALEHVADPATHGPDHAFDRWAVAAGSKSAYCGSLWLAALRACAGLAASLDETHAAVSLDATGARAARALNDALWVDVATDSNTNTTPKKTRGYYKHDESVGALGNASSVSQVFGEWALATLGLAPAHPKERTRAALETVLRVNARGGATFPANAAEASSFVSETDSETETETEPVSNANLHSGERWPAFAYVVAAHAVLVTDDYISAHDASLFDSGSPEEEEEEDALLLRRAWASARNAYDATWNGGLAFRAPEATDDEGRFRGAADVKNGAVWALDRALTQKARRARDAGRERKASVEDDRRRRSADELRR